MVTGDKVRKPNLQSPAFLAGTQNLTNTAQQNEDNDVAEEEATIKEDFLRTTNSESNDNLNSNDPFDQKLNSPTESSPESQIQSMTREAGDGQNDTSNENTE